MRELVPDEWRELDDSLADGPSPAAVPDEAKAWLEARSRGGNPRKPAARKPAAPTLAASRPAARKPPTRQPAARKPAR